MAISEFEKSEGFERVNKQTFENGVKYRTPLGLIFELVTDKHARGATPSGFQVPDSSRAFGNRELVVGDNSIVSLQFPKPAINFGFKYYVDEDYTLDDEEAEANNDPDTLIKSRPTTDTTVAFQIVLTDAQGKQSIFDAPIESSTQQERIDDIPFNKVHIISSCAGTVHFDSIKWTET